MDKIDICLSIDIVAEDLDSSHSLHAHLVITPFKRISLKIYINEVGEKALIAWIHNRPNHKDFARSISVLEIKSPKHISNIDFSNSSIAMIGYGDNFNDHGGSFVGIDLKEVSVSFTLTDHVSSISEIYLDNHAFDIAHNLISVDAFNSNAKTWQAEQGSRKRLFTNEFEFDFLEGISNDSYGYPQLISRLPRIIIFHKDSSYPEILKSAYVVTSALSFFQSHEIDFNQLEYYGGNFCTVCYRPRKEKEKILRKNLGRFEIETDVLSFLESLGNHLTEQQELAKELVRLFNLAIQMDGTSKFMLLFTVIEKLRNQLDTTAKAKEKFSFTNNKRVNEIIREMLTKVRELVDSVQRSLFEEAEEDKLSTIKYLPQKEQFNGLFDILSTNPVSYGLDFKQVVSTRGAIFHGKYYESEDKFLEDINEKLLQFSGNLLYRYFTMP